MVEVLEEEEGEGQGYNPHAGESAVDRGGAAVRAGECRIGALV
jgi:hypothetical protein